MYLWRVKSEKEKESKKKGKGFREEQIGMEERGKYVRDMKGKDVSEV